ncbi:hypothetical protein C0J52_19161 [Blattella germanica]|nr:hypothetical protein C0J52_19161 [Blattella germanica]
MAEGIQRYYNRWKSVRVPSNISFSIPLHSRINLLNQSPTPPLTTDDQEFVLYVCKMANLESGSELPNLKIEIENDLEDAMETDDNENKMEYKTIKDDDPEEGELSDSKDVVKDAKVSTYGLNASTNDVTWDREKRYENKGGAFVTGVDIFAKEVQSKLHERAKRFGLDPSDVKAITDHQITELYKSLGVKEKEEEGAEKHFRLNALHMRGTEDLSTQDIFNYFKDYGPASIEWINDFSCNVVWLDNISAARAMIGLSKHIKGLEEFHSKADPFLKQEEKEKGSDKENEKEEIVIVQEIEEPDGDDIIMVMERSSTFIPPTKPTDEKVDEEMSVDSDEVQASEITIPIPPGKWRMGVPHPKAKCILLRFSTRTDKKQPQAEKMSEYYKKYGNPNYGGIKGIITQSRKRRYQRQDHNSKVFEDDQGDERDFSEPPADGKNPWGNLAKTWSKLDKTRSRRKSAPEERNKWKILWEDFRNDYENAREGICGYPSPEEMLSTWPFFESLQFLANHFDPKESIRNLKHYSETENNISESEPGIDFYDSSESTSGLRSTSMRTCNAKDECSNNVFGREVLATGKETETSRNCEVAIDEDTTFFTSLIPRLKSLPPNRKMLFKMDVQRLLYDYCFGEETDVPDDIPN